MVSLPYVFDWVLPKKRNLTEDHAVLKKYSKFFAQEFGLI